MVENGKRGRIESIKREKQKEEHRRREVGRVKRGERREESIEKAWRGWSRVRGLRKRGCKLQEI